MTHDGGLAVENIDDDQAVAELARKIGACTNIDELRALLAAELVSLVPVHDRVSIAFVEPDGEWLRIHRILPIVDAPQSALPKVRVEGTPVGQVARDGIARIVGDTRTDPNITFGHASHDGIRSTVSVPIRVASRVVGVMNAGSRTPGACNAEMLAVMERVAAVVGPAFYELEAGKPRARSPELVGRSPAFHALLAAARRAAPSDADVLITGETGVGKTAIARALHQWSPRRAGPFVTVHLADLSPTLIEAELFGYDRGAFTGATSARIGRFESAAGGTILLDEIGETPLAIQTKLLRFIQDRCFERVGGTRTIDADVRIIAATNIDLRAAVRRREFREDLYFRLGVVPLHVPPLRERGDDLDLLVDAILARIAARDGRVRRLSAAARARVHAYAWPGNVRELETVLHGASILEEADELELAALGDTQALEPGGAPAASPAQWVTLREHERAYIEQILAAHDGAVEGPHGVARILGLPASTLRSRMKKLGITARRTNGGAR